MKKMYLCAILGAFMLTGCGNNEMEVILKNDADQAYVNETEEVVTVPQETMEEATTSEVASETEVEEVLVSPAKEIFEQYKDDLTQLHFYDAEEAEIIIEDDYIELTDMVITEKLYLEATYVESLSVGATITIKDIPYTINRMEHDDYGYYVELSTDEEADFEHGKYVYEDIYRFAPTDDKQNYFILFCSDDIIEEEIYEGSIYLTKDATINTYYYEEIKDMPIEEYLMLDNPFISSVEFTIDDNGFVTWIQNQIAG